ncbi:MAG: VacJ family lipoprotein [Sphingomonadaceae bacterium]|nr:VacJ family lipoprotein [Sphingomonadaceae bacterium]
MRNLFAILALVLLGACATTQNGPNGVADRDPHEGFNRAMWDFNQAIDRVVLRPVSDVYREIVPRPARRGIVRLFDNLMEPFSAINNLLQGKPERALNNLGRFVINSTIGVGGLADHATDLGLEPTPEDFGQTLAVWGVGDGGYLVLPLFGPSTVRDGFGILVDQLANPYRVVLRDYSGLSGTERIPITVTDVISSRAEASEAGVDAFLETSADPYAAARAAYFERREAAILDYDLSGAMSATEGGEGADADFEAAVDEMAEPPADAPPDPAPPPE